MNVKLLTTTQSIQDMENFAALAELTCHGNTDKEYVPSEVLTHIIKAGHESVLEHVNLTFSIQGLSRACLQELARHRHISMSVESTRHTLREKLEDTDGVMDISNNTLLRFQKELLKFFDFAYRHSDMPNDVLKYYIPEFWPTNLIITLNVREFRHILKLRTAPDALKEFQTLARSMFNEIPEQFNYLLSDCVHAEVNNE